MQSNAKLLIQYVAPTILSNCCFFLFSIVDGIFVGHGVGTDALGAVNIVFPFLMTVNALFMLTTIGGVTVAAIRLGRGDRPGANQAFLHSVTGTLIIALLLTLVGAGFTDPVTRLLGANQTFHQLVAEYLFWYSLFIVPSGLSVTLQGFARNDGAPVLVSGAVIFGTVCNIFGDWLLVFPLQMGLKGAAIATGVSQTITLLLLLPHFLRRKGALSFQRFRPSWPLVRKVLFRGLPESIAQFATPVTTLCMNYMLLAHVGDIGVNAFSVIGYVASFSVAIFFGSAEGLQPLFGRCYGAKEDENLHWFFRAGLLINLSGSVIITIALHWVGGPICALFGVDGETLAFTVEHMPQYAWGFIIMSLNTIISSYLYSTKRSPHAIAINVLRSFLVNTAVILILPGLLGAGVIWYTFGIYELIVLAVAVALLRYSERNGVVYTPAR